MTQGGESYCRLTWRETFVFEVVSDRAGRALVLAQEQSRLLRHDYIGTEHLLLGLLDEDHTASRALLDSLVRPADIHQRGLTRLPAPTPS